jgi:thiamine-monophosphate kinase
LHINEFDLIRQYFDQPGLADAADSIALGIGDDCALLRPIAGHVAAITTDTLVAGRHFSADTPAHAIGWKSLAVSLSDLAAIGATPQAFLLALTLPEFNASWLADFAAGLHALCNETSIHLIGGDTTRGPLTINITAIGQVPEMQALRRAGAKPGDFVCVTGTLGDAALALRLTKPPLSLADDLSDASSFALYENLQKRLDYPTPRLAEGIRLRGIASAAIDLSDGLAGDLRHILDASNVGVEINVDDLPMSPAFEWFHDHRQRLQLQASGGDDYELCVCIPPQRLAEAQAAVGHLLKPVGRITARTGLRWLDHNGAVLNVELKGYDHFRS